MINFRWEPQMANEWISKNAKLIFKTNIISQLVIFVTYAVVVVFLGKSFAITFSKLFRLLSKWYELARALPLECTAARLYQSITFRSSQRNINQNSLAENGLGGEIQYGWDKSLFHSSATEFLPLRKQTRACYDRDHRWKESRWSI